MRAPVILPACMGTIRRLRHRPPDRLDGARIDSNGRAGYAAVLTLFSVAAFGLSPGSAFSLANAASVNGAQSASGGWSAPEVVPTGGANLAAPIALDAEGDALAVWDAVPVSATEIGSAQALHTAIHPVGGHWQPSTTFSRPGYRPGVAEDPFGDSLAVWETSLTSAAAGPAPEIMLGTGREMGQVASDAKGDLTVIAPFELPSKGLFVATRPANGAFFKEEISAVENVGPGAVAMNAQGDTIAAWEGERSGCPVAAFRPANGAWSTPHVLSEQHGCASGLVRSVAVEESGAAVVVWQVTRGATSLIEVAGRTSAGRWISPRAIARGPDVTDVQLGVDARGDELLAWADERGTEAAARPAGGSWQKPQIVARREPGIIGRPEPPLAAIDDRGDGILLWQSATVTRTAWHASLFP